MAAKRMPAARLTHVDSKGRARMVDVGGKPATERLAVARGESRARREQHEQVREPGAHHARARPRMRSTA